MREFDGLGRAKGVTLPDGTTVQTTYAGTVTTATDQAGKSRRSKVDALGRLVRLDEPDSYGNLGAVNSPVQATAYEYDGLNNLTKITQGEQVRLFKYDSLSRLTHQRQVEATPTLNDQGAAGSQWTHVTKYNAEGLVTDTFDARGVCAHSTSTTDLID